VKVMACLEGASIRNVGFPMPEELQHKKQI
jgi:hypothetical protein